MSNTGIANDSLGGGVSNSTPDLGNSSGAQDRANADYGSGGPSAGGGNNVEKDYGEREEKGGVKGVMNKITDKMNPSHTEPASAQQGLGKDEAKLGGAGNPTRERKSGGDLNKE